MSDFDTIFVGLGNPGISPIIRHNVGFLFLDYLNDRFGDGEWNSTKTYKFSRIRLGRWKVLLCKPYQNYNISGEAVSRALSDFDLIPQQISCIHDDVDLKFGSVRVKNGGSSGGCNGIKSIDSVLNTNDYNRIRVGIGRPAHGKVTGDWVCGDFPEEDLTLMHQLFIEMGDKLENISSVDVEGLRILNKK